MREPAGILGRMGHRKSGMWSSGLKGEQACGAADGKADSRPCGAASEAEAGAQSSWRRQSKDMEQLAKTE